MMQLNHQSTQPRADGDRFQGDREPYGHRGIGRGNLSGNVDRGNPHRYQTGRDLSHSVKCTESATEAQGNTDTWAIIDACSTIKLSKLLIRDENEVLFKMQTPSFGFVQRLQQGSNSQVMVQLLVKVIAKACTSVHQTQLLDLLSKVHNSNFLDVDLVKYLNQFISDDKMVDADICNSIITILRTSARLFPSKSLAVITLLCAPIHRILTIDTPDYGDAKNDYKKLQEETTEIRKQLQSGTVQRDQERQVEWTVEESDDYKRMSVIPTSEDISGQGDPYLRENKIYQPYKDAHDYLDVQFRLMKEDLVRPLREGLAELLHNREVGNNRRTKTNMKVYSQVQITSVRCSQHGLIYKIQFDVSRLRHIRWEAAKRLIFGSLVCLSADEFKNMLLATVAERDARDLSRGITHLYFDSDTNGNTDIKLDQMYEMIESPAYYEPYKCVLQALQKFTDEEKLPFERYLLNKTGEESVPSPKYLTEDVKYDFSSLILKDKGNQSGCISRIHLDWFELRMRSEETVIVLDLSSWPTAVEVGLDASQYSALQTAITKEFAVIQGPPGTGKTFIGVKIVQLMLENNARERPLWSGPIMLVCYTNHALDQFLEEIISIYPDGVDEGLFIRIGGSSKSENEQLKKCFLKQVKRNSTSYYRGATIEPRANMAALEEQIMKLSAYAEISGKELIHPFALTPYMRQVHFNDTGSFLLWLCDRNAKPGIPDLLHVDANEDGRQNQYDLDHQPYLEDEYENQELLETEEREKNEHDWKTAEEKFQAIVKSVLEGNIFVKLNGQETKHFKKLYQTAQSIHRHFHEAFQELDDNIAIKDQRQLSLADRWRLYNYWTKCFIAARRDEIQRLLKDYATEKRKLEEVQSENDYNIFMDAKIIAMTTTGAASRSDLLKRLAPKIVIVEEAAEVLEAHVVASLSEKCEHLILIGDHQQLKPKPTDYSLAKRYRLDISLFEKMVLNKLHCDRLAIQHRMRPEIAELLVPHIYKSLENHDSVLKYDNVANIFGNLFFVSHSEAENSTDDNRSHSNDHEATFVSELCRYLLNVGYEPKQITVLTTYTGQFFLLRKLMPKSEFEGVRVTPVDNFQGEENDIILLSLVRSNEDSNIGFLKISNRICVALSRARKGLYIFGNGDILRDESPLWRDILDTLKKQDKLVDSLPLGCRNHPDNVVFVKGAADFQNVSRNGCEYPCDYRLPYGHVCAKHCHELDADHQRYKCTKRCSKSCANNIHPCRKLCYVNCGDCEVLVERILSRCGHEATMGCYLKEEAFNCGVLVTRTLPSCQHEATMPCSFSELRYLCKEACKKACPFGHPCSRLCFKICGSCEVLVTRTLPVCKHEAEMPCHISEKTFKCKESCTKSCSSSHPCQKLCHEICGNCMNPVTKTLSTCKHQAIMPCFMDEQLILTQIKCTVEVEVTLPLCRHVVKLPCHMSGKPYKCLEPCKKSCSYGHPCEKKCHEPCGDCVATVEKVLPRCEHKAMMPCYQNVDSYICQISCNRVCPSGHSCPDLCHEKCGDCQVSVEKVLPGCGHKAIMPCYKEPSKHRCQLPCERKCPEAHLCPRICGTYCGICTQKKEKIFIQCNHVNVIECFQYPNHLVCKSSCERFLRCGHKCQEICGAAECTITCMVKVEKELPCMHIASTYCHLDSSLVECHQEIEKKLPCDHVTLVECHQNPVTFVCPELVEQKLPCEHIARVSCSMDPATYICLQKVKVEVCDYGHTAEINCCEMAEFKVQCLTPSVMDRNGCLNICKFKLDCGHGCSRTCRECVSTKTHGKCKEIFSKSFSLCPHKSLCIAPTRSCNAFSSYRCHHRSNTSYTCTESYEICLRSCDWNCPHYACTAICSQSCNRPPCNHPCRKPLDCRHVCSGLCGEPCLSACRKCNKRSFSERTWPDFSSLSDQSRFLELQPCRHFAEVAAMDVWIQETVHHLPGLLDGSCFLRCPFCSEKVNFCPRYSQYNRRHELCLNAAKKLIKDSGNLERTMEEYVALWVRTKQYNIEIEQKLDQLEVTKRIRLGMLCILHEIDVLESQRKNSNTMQKCKSSVLEIRQRISEEGNDLYFDDKPRLAFDVLMMYKLYLDVQVRRLVTFVRGPNLRVLDQCCKLLGELECFEICEDNFMNIWIKIEKINRKLSRKLSTEDRRDEIIDYVDHLNRFYDLQLGATFLKHWACCRYGHVYSTEDEPEKDQIDASCPQCHTLHSVLLCFLKPEFDETRLMTNIETATYYKRNEEGAGLSNRKTTDSDCCEYDALREVVPDGNTDISRIENIIEETHSNLRAKVAPRSVQATPDVTVVGQPFFRGPHPGRRGGGRYTPRMQVQPNLDDYSDIQRQRSPYIARDSQASGQFGSSNSAQQSVDSSRQVFRSKDPWHGDGESCSQWRTKDGKAKASTFTLSSFMRDGASAAKVRQTRPRQSCSVSSDEKNPKNWRAPADHSNSRRSASRDGRGSPLSWRDRPRSSQDEWK